MKKVFFSVKVKNIFKKMLIVAPEVLQSYIHLYWHFFIFMRTSSSTYLASSFFMKAKSILKRIDYFYFIKFLATCACLTPEVMSYNSEKYKKQKKMLSQMPSQWALSKKTHLLRGWWLNDNIKLFKERKVRKFSLPY